jgi:hypothetical protein
LSSASLSSAPSSGDGRASGAIASGTKLKLVDLSSEDAYYSDKSRIVGKSCTATGNLTDHGGGWYGGAIKCDDGSSFYFYKVGVSVSGGAKADSGGSKLTGSVPRGTRVRITDIAADDAYYSDRTSIIGKVCTTGDATSDNGGGWHGGPISCDDGSSYYFYKAALAGAASDGAGTAAGSTAAQDLGDKVADGTRVTIRGLRSGDLYYDNRGDYIGQACTVKGDFHRNDGLFYGGGLTCGGQYWYFAYVSVSRR